MESNKLCTRCLWDPTASSCRTKLTQRWTWKNMDIKTVIRYCWGAISKYVSKKLMHTIALTSPNITKQIDGKQLPKTQKSLYSFNLHMRWSDWVAMDYTCAPYERSADSPYRWALHKPNRRTSSSPECVRYIVFSVSNLNKTNNRSNNAQQFVVWGNIFNQCRCLCRINCVNLTWVTEISLHNF